jgi:hypothetical protein
MRTVFYEGEKMYIPIFYMEINKDSLLDRALATFLEQKLAL